MSDQRLAGPHDRHDEARLLQAAARERLSVMSADLQLPQRLRLTDWQRSTVVSLGAKLIRAIEDELRTMLGANGIVREHDGLAAALLSAHVAIAGPILERHHSASDPSLVSTLVRRAEEHRRARARASAEMSFLIEFSRDKDPLVAEHAMALIIGQSRRFDSFGEPAAARTELSAEQEHRLVWRVVAALRRYMVDSHSVDPALADELIVDVAERLLSEYDEGDALEARAMRLARRLGETGRLSDQLIERALGEGSLTFFLAGIAVRTSLSHASAWEILFEPKGRGAVFLLRAAEIERSHAAAILLALSDTEDEVPAQVDLFDVTEASAAREALRLWRFNPGYREAIAELGQ